jgi:tRNA(Ile)-lysidine synthase
MFPEVEQALVRACETIEEEIEWTDPMLSDWLDEATERMDSDGAELRTARLAEMPAGALHRVLRMALEEARGDLLEVSREQVQRVADLVTTGQAGREVELPGGWTARRGYERLTLERARSQPLASEEAVPLLIPGMARLDLRGVQVEAEETAAPDDMNGGDAAVVYLNAEAASDGLVLRSWHEGERIQPLGMDGSKKLSDLFTDLKVPADQRREVAVVARPNGEILWVVGHRLSETARVATGSPAVKLTARAEPERT